ncbi:hypothetical protein RGR602_CH00144 [Rhizobium gallicum bv. gallicum R602sp]|uniref:Alpha/beta hydrolase family domain-containing protein n=1 Tax=Rhizobium gallicum bv. gallicum R602sp TaxID=1041138 RepID=A0A0B4WYX7_9HYPH|nr:hypothetical protein RGR602_CH00144 [Rhizobium gallicum bv. gallicum R602sp]
MFILEGLGSADVRGRQAEDLAKDHLVIVADSRGHGRSTRSGLIIRKDASHFAMLQDPEGYDAMIRDAMAGK